MHDSHVFVFIHITMGILGILTGFLALGLRKGSPRHRLAGNVFVVAMLTMSSVAFFMAYVGTEVTPPRISNILSAVFTFYLVATAWLTVRRRDGRRNLIDLAGFLVISAVVAGYITSGLKAVHSPTGMEDHYPPGVYFFFGAWALMAAVGDVRMLVLRGLTGAQRIARHLWRMCFGLWIAATSLFLGQPQVFPAWLHRTRLLVVPSLLIIVLLIYWVIRVLFTSAYKRKLPAPSAPGPEAPLP